MKKSKHGRDAPDADKHHARLLKKYGQPVLDAFASWKAGAALRPLEKDLGMNLKGALIDIAGGSQAFKELRTRGAGDQRQFGKRRNMDAPKMNDQGVHTIRRARASKGWKTEWVWRPVSVQVKDVGRVAWRECVAMIFTSPKGRRYVQAQDNEKADLIVLGMTQGIKPARLRLYEHSATARHVRAAEDSTKRGLAAHKAKKKAKHKKQKALQQLTHSLHADKRSTARRKH